MTIKKPVSLRLLSMLICLALILSYLPASVLTVSAAEAVDNRVTDPSTLDGWKTYFAPENGNLSTENAGGVWTNKSVLTAADPFAGSGITLRSNENFLVALSAIASNKTVTGMSSLPTDTMLVLDVSGSMNNDEGNNNVAAQLVSAANDTLQALLEMNPNNRVGVVLYSGMRQNSGNAQASDAVLILPLGRYDTGNAGKYLTYTRSDGDEFVGLDSTVVLEGTTTAPETAGVVKEVVGGTFTQRGIILAMDQFLAADTSFTDPVLGTVQRMPVLVLMSDGAASVVNTDFVDPSHTITKADSTQYPNDPFIGKGYDMGDGTTGSITSAMGFVTQLSAAYAKQQIQAKYGTDCFFYTLGLGAGVSSSTVATSILDPANSSTAITIFWEQYNAESLMVGDRLQVKAPVTEKKGYGYNSYTVTVQPARTVEKLAGLEKNYVDRYFPVSGNSSSDLAAGLTQAFAQIVSQISLQSKYFPTLVSGSEDLDGYISFVDRLGSYMQVKDMKGILIGSTLFSGADLARNFAPDAAGGALGTMQAPTALGDEMVHAVMYRLGLATADEARTLITMAYNAGQLRYNSSTDYSNYIGWYANAAGKFLGFWHEGITTMPDPSDPALTDETRPVYIIKSYGYLGAVDAEHGVAASDMMYATIQVRQSIATGEQTVLFAIPAALIPVISYHVTLDEDGALTKLTVQGAQAPIRLVYEVGLQDGIDAFNFQEQISPSYLAENTNADGTVNFYTNSFEKDGSTGFGKANTYSYFNPSRQNDRYYFLEDAPIYTDENGTLYTGTAQPSGQLYRKHTIYTLENGVLSTHTGYHMLAQGALDAAQRSSDGSWYVPKGTVRTDIDGYTLLKSENATGTLPFADEPFVDTHDHAPGDLGYNFYVGATLGNNGRITFAPATGLVLAKAFNGAAPAEAVFNFNISGNVPNGDYSARRSDGTATTVTFSDGMAKVSLKAGENIHIIGLPENVNITITEEASAEYILESINGVADVRYSYITASGKLESVIFTNALRGKGNLTVGKEISHDFGSAYQIPADKRFNITVILKGMDVVNKRFAASLTGSELSYIETDSEGRFTVSLAHDQQLTIRDLPDGTIATVAELDPGLGFTAQYWDNGQPGDGQVAIVKDNTASVIVLNDYAPARVYPVNIAVSGTKVLTGRDWLETDVFTFRLEKWLSDGSWQPLATTTVNGSSADKTFSFAEAFAQEAYTAAGAYHYRVVELEPEDGQTGGLMYDKTIHSFTVEVGDTNMDGKLEITDVRTQRPDTTHIRETADGYHVSVDFTNVYSYSGSASAALDLVKEVTNPSFSPEAKLAGFTFGLFDENGKLLHQSPATTDLGLARIILEYSAPGTYRYTLREIVPGVIPAGWQYSSQEIPITVEVTDTGTGSLRATISQSSVTFTNIYAPAAAELTLDFVTKVLTGRDMVAGEFSFYVEDLDGKLLTSGTNNAEGKVTFAQALTFTKVGTYFLNIREVGSDVNGLTMDKTLYRVTVTITDGGDGKLTAGYSIVNMEGSTITFRNHYTAQPAQYQLQAQKLLTGRVLLNDEFGFTLKNIETGESWQARNFSDGSIRFPVLTFTEIGTYVFEVTEDGPTGSSYGIVYDETKYTVTIEVSDTGTGQLQVAGVSFGDAESIVFENTYIPAPTTAIIPGTKTLEGQVLTGGDFTFQLFASDEVWAEGTLLHEVRNDKDGLFRFPELSFAKAGTYRYLVKEEHGGETIDGLVYDDTIFRVQITITDDLRGQLHAQILITDQYGIPQEDIHFVNIRKSPPSNPDTGDANALALWAALLFVSGGALVTTVRAKKKEETA